MEGVTLRDQNLGPHDIETGHHFRDRVLHLDAGIHFDEEPLVPIQIVEKFYRAGIVVTNLLGHTGRGCT